MNNAQGALLEKEVVDPKSSILLQHHHLFLVVRENGEHLGPVTNITASSMNWSLRRSLDLLSSST